MASRPLRVHRLELVRIIDHGHAEFELQCGKGGYVRSIARDLGEDLGCLAHVRTLRRLATGPFTIDGCLALDEITRPGTGAEPERLLLPLEFGLSGLPEIRGSGTDAARIRNGMSCRFNFATDSGTAWVSCEGRAVAMGELRNGVFRPRRVFRDDSDDGRPDG